jgi:hypothetical protein
MTQNSSISMMNIFYILSSEYKVHKKGCPLSRILDPSPIYIIETVNPYLAGCPKGCRNFAHIYLTY